MDKVYYSDTYLRNLDCKVVEVTCTDKATEVRTDRTIFYPECGGQPGDRGHIGPYQVLDTRKGSDGDSILILAPKTPIRKGDALELVLDWDHRYKFMVMHAAQHMLSGLMFTMFDIGTVAVHQGDEYLTIETNKDHVEEAAIDALVLAANEKIRENHRIVYHEMSHSDAEALGLRRSIKVEGDVRIVEIEGVDRIACGGLHVAGTSEIGLVHCIGHEQIRGHVRLYFKCGESALKELLDGHRTLQSLAHFLTCGVDELEAKVTSMAVSMSDLKSRCTQVQRRLAQYEISEAKGPDGVCVLRCEEGSDLQNHAQAVSSMEDVALLALCPDNGRFKWLIALKGEFEKIDFNVLIRPLLARINAKGGGRSPVFQGVANCNDEKAIDLFIEEFKLTVLG